MNSLSDIARRFINKRISGDVLGFEKQMLGKSFEFGKKAGKTVKNAIKSQTKKFINK